MPLKQNKLKKNKDYSILQMLCCMLTVIKKELKKNCGKHVKTERIYCRIKERLSICLSNQNHCGDCKSGPTFVDGIDLRLYMLFYSISVISVIMNYIRNDNERSCAMKALAGM